MSAKKKIKQRWFVPAGLEPTEMDQKIMEWQEKGKIVPTRDLIKTHEQIEGIRQAGVLNTAVLDLVAEKIHEGMSTLEIDQLVYDFTTKHGGVPAPLHYEGFPNSCCTSINDVVCHGIPSADDILIEGDIINVDCTTILNGYYADASRMFVIGKTTPERQRLVDVAWDCLKAGEKVCQQPYVFVGDIGNAVAKLAHANGYTVVRDLCGHGVGVEFHEEPDVVHYGRKGTGMLLVPGMTFTIEPMINEGDWEVCGDAEDPTEWIVLTEDGTDSAQWEHTYLMTENGVEILTH
ncbi:MAG: type I methionyl aminopeptidase [Prevotellaceae bacterium]|nr:type I methionyl aminopeptidase [Prevotellaceae bacterium]